MIKLGDIMNVFLFCLLVFLIIFLIYVIIVHRITLIREEKYLDTWSKLDKEIIKLLSKNNKTMLVTYKNSQSVNAKIKIFYDTFISLKNLGKHQKEISLLIDNYNEAMFKFNVMQEYILFHVVSLMFGIEKGVYFPKK